MDFRVELPIYRGPLDLLLYLVRKHEMDIIDIQVAVITEQYMSYLEVLAQIDVNAVGDFLELASTLVEIKSRSVLPHAGEEEVVDDPRADLVRRLLEYKRFKEAATILDERSRAWQERYSRSANDEPELPRDLATEPIHELELWDLVSAFGRVMRDRQANQAASIVYDDTPIHVFMERIHAALLERGRLAFTSLFEPGMHRSTLVGMFLAILELIRHHGAQVQQNELFGEIWILPGEENVERGG